MVWRRGLWVVALVSCASRRPDRCPVSRVVHTQPVALVPGPYVVAMSMSVTHQCASFSDGTLRCQGHNDWGQIGLGISDTMIPHWTLVPGLRDVEEVITTDANTTCTRHRDGTVRCWGSNEHGQLGAGYEGETGCGSLSPQNRCRSTPTLVPNLSDVVQLAHFWSAMCALRRNGRVWCWGGVGLPRLPALAPHPQPIPSLVDVVSIDTFELRWFARHRDGRITELGPREGRFFIPEDATFGAHQDSSHRCYRRPDATVRCLGSNHHGQLGVGTSLLEGITDPGLCGVRSVVTGAYHTCALLEDETVWCWGDIVHERPPQPMEPDLCVGVRRDRASVSCTARPTRIAGLDHVEALFAGTWKTCARRTDHTLWCWGFYGMPTTPTLTEW